MTASRAFAVGVALLCATCCPSLFLTITRSRPAPRQPLPAAQAPKEPLPRPPEIANRFDVLLRGAPLPAGHDPAYDAYDDEAAPDHHGASTDGLMAIARDFGAPGIPVIAAPAPRINGCVGCPGGHCNEVLVDVPSASIQPGRDARPSAALFAGPLSYLTVVENIEDSIAEDAAVVFPGCTVHDGQTVIHFSGAVADLRPAQIVEVMVSPWSVAQTLTSFVQISDVQIRDADIRLGDRVLSNRLDKLIESMEYDQDLEFYNRYVVEALFATINGVARYYRDAAPHSPEKPDFVIHTGDAIDSGMMSELREVHHLFDQLELPTFDALGNHDVLVFGNIMPTADHTDHACGTAISAARPKAHLLDDHPGLLPDKLCVNAQVDCPDCLPGEAKLVAGLSHLEAHRNFMSELARHVDYAVPVFDHPGGGAYCKGPDGNDAFEGAPAISPAAIGHGFDLNTYVDPRDGNRYPRGYYAFVRPIELLDGLSNEARNAVYIVLDTNDLDKHEAGSVGRIGRDQMTWLGNVLRCVERQHPKDLVLAFGHHGLRDTRSAGESIEHALASSKNVIGYFYGHDHVHGICRPKGSCTHFWEVMTASVIEYPQEARLVRIKYAGAGLGFLEVTTFGERNQNGGDAFARAVELGHRGAERDWCNSGQAQMCSEDKRVYRDDARHTNARLFFRLPEYRSDCCDVLPGT